MPPRLIVLDEETPPGDLEGVFLHWSRLDVPPGHYSLPRLVEENIETLRADYLALIHDLGEMEIRGKTLREHLSLTDDFSYWWMTLLAEKSPVKTPEIYTVFKLRALENFYLEHGCRGLILRLPDRILNRALKPWLKSLRHEYQWRPVKGARSSFSPKGLAGRAPHFLKALVFLWRYWRHRARLVRPVQSGMAFGETTVLTYFPNFDKKKAAEGVYRSRYWEDLQELLEDQGKKVNWIWMFAPNSECSYAKALEIRDRFMGRADPQTSCRFLEEFLPRGEIIQVLAQYMRIALKTVAAFGLRRGFRFKGGGPDLWPVLSRAWKTSTCGWAAMDSCLWLGSFQSLAKALPPQRLTLYLCEGQAWEKALIKAWREEGRGRVVGFQHGALRFLNLRTYEDPRSYKLTSFPPVLPDLVAVNGQGARRLLSDVGHPEEKMVVVEALRHMYLEKMLKAEARQPEEKNLLVVTGYRPDETRELLTVLRDGLEVGGGRGLDRITVKPHPDTPVLGMLQDLGLTDRVVVDESPLGDLFQKAWAVFGANSTTACLEAALSGKPLIVHQEPDALNLSPLYRLGRTVFVSDGPGLAQSLTQPKRAEIGADYFYLNREYPAWKGILN